MSFSQRYGHVGAPVVQHDGIDDRLRNALWSVMYEPIETVRDYGYNNHDSGLLARWLVTPWVEFFGAPADACKESERALQVIRNMFFEMPWYRVYDFVEFVAKRWDEKHHVIKPFNVALEREHSAYRVSDGGNVLELTDKIQLAALDRAMADSSELGPVHTHLLAAQECLAQRGDKVDYRNCINLDFAPSRRCMHDAPS